MLPEEAGEKRAKREVGAMPGRPVVERPLDQLDGDSIEVRGTKAGLLEPDPKVRITGHDPHSLWIRPDETEQLGRVLGEYVPDD